ncbi:MAG: SDR family oxidoreductase, partial [Nitrospiria bacterium]
PISLDLSDLSKLPQALSRIDQDHPDVSGIIACAGQGRFGGLEGFSFEEIRAAVDVNFVSQCFLVKAFLPRLKRSKRSDIVFIGSEAALVGGKHGAVYAATKFAIRGFAQSLRKECAKSGVRITLINPGMVKTHFFDTLHFAPGPDEDNYIEAADVAETILSVLHMRPGTVIDEINLSPLKKVMLKKQKPKKREGRVGADNALEID